MTVDWSDFFIAALPPLVIFDMNVQDLSALVRGSVDVSDISNTTVEVCLIGLGAYFEAFCKNLFAAVINICPDLLAKFCESREVTVSVGVLLKVRTDLDRRLGSVLAEQHDFGSPKAINSLFYQLLGITVFSKDEQKRYGQFLSDRNLLVHHGGVYTIKYQGQEFVRKEQIIGQRRIHFDSLVVRKKDFESWVTFVGDLAGKMAVNTHRAATELISTYGIQLGPAAANALGAIPAGFDDLGEHIRRVEDAQNG